ncbi:MAG: amidohydrolase family protein [Clostridia bacterium]|nr:amidohydrolase family protein [Clostridia bacterium]
MYQLNSVNFRTIREYLENIPVIDTHDHFATFMPANDPLDFIMDTFYLGDFYTAGGEKVTGKGDFDFFRPIPHDLPLQKRYDIFQKYWHDSCHTAYARAVQEGIRLCYGVKDIGTWDGFSQFADAFSQRNAAIYDKVMKDCHIKAQIADRGDLDNYMNASIPHSSLSRFTFHMSQWRNIHTKEHLMNAQSILGRTITCLDDYLKAFDRYFDICRAYGVVCLKDLNAYRRTLDFTHPTKAEADKAFNELVFHQRTVYSDADVRPFEDYLFHHALRKAAEYDLPIQLHTGHMASTRNDVRKANAINLVPTLEMHTDVRFSLLHANWPYMDEYLFLGKNFPNVYLDLCWAQVIDPIYTIELMKRCVMTVPHSKIMAFGADTSHPEWLAGYLSLTKDNVAYALAQLCDTGWLTLSQAKAIALDWFYNNPNQFFSLGLDPVQV